MTQWPVRQDFAHTGLCTKAQNTVAAHRLSIFSHQNSGFWNSGILELRQCVLLKAEVGTRKRLSNWPFPENPEPPDPRIPDSGILYVDIYVSLGILFAS